MLRPRIIPCLLVSSGGLVKTTEFAKPKYVGDPINTVKIFNEKETDELMVLDIDATARGVAPDLSLIARLAMECRMPLCYGGGVRSVEQAREIIALGVEKVAVSAAAVNNPRLVADIASAVGSQSVAVVLDVRLRKDGGYDVWTHNGRVKGAKTLWELIPELERAGAGEIVVNSIDADGKMRGYDLALAKAVRGAVRVPTTFVGGAGSLADLSKLIAECGVVGAAAGSLFVFKGPYKAVLINYPSRSQKDELLRTAIASRARHTGPELT